MTVDQAWQILMDDLDEWKLTGADVETRQRYRSKMNRDRHIPLETKIEYIEKAGMVVEMKVYRPR